MVTADLPKLSIGLPVFNGERYLRFVLDSILNQTFRNFELIISDNASTDSTMQICQEYATRDNRIHYVRNLENTGSAANFNHTFELSRGQYFKWAAADDILSPTFLEKCIEVLDCDPSIVLCYSKVNRIDSSGEVDGTYDYPMRVSDPDPHVRFADLILVNHFCIAVFGVMRREVLAKTPLIGKYVGSDRVLLAELGLRGPMFEIPEYLFHRRDHPQASGRMFDPYKRLAWFDPAKRNHINPIYWRTGAEYFHSVNRVAPAWSLRLACYRTVALWFWLHRPALVEDIKAIIVQFAPFSLGLAHFAKRLFATKKYRGGL